MDSVLGRDPQRVLDVLAKAEAAAEGRRADVEVWYEQARGYLADFAASVQQAGERLNTQVEALQGNAAMPGVAPALGPAPTALPAGQPPAAASGPGASGQSESAPIDSGPRASGPGASGGAGPGQGEVDHQPPLRTAPELPAAGTPGDLARAAAVPPRPGTGEPAWCEGASAAAATADGAQALPRRAPASRPTAPPRPGTPGPPTAPVEPVAADEQPADHRGSAYAVVEPREAPPRPGRPQFSGYRSGTPQPAAPEYGTPQYGVPGYGAPHYGTPQYGTGHPADPKGRARPPQAPGATAGHQLARTGGGAVAWPDAAAADPVVESLGAYQARLLADSEQAADRMLASAEEQAAQLLADARSQADQVMRSAKFHAERMIGNAKMESALTARRVAELRALERKLRESIKGMLSGGDGRAPAELDYVSPQDPAPGADHPSWTF